MIETFIISPLAIVLSLCTSTSVLLHETKVDKLAALTMTAPIAARQIVDHANVALDSIPHTHVESGSLQPATGELRTQNPSQNPRRNEDKKYRLQKKVAKGVYSFDSYHLPLHLTELSR